MSLIIADDRSQPISQHSIVLDLDETLVHTQETDVKSISKMLMDPNYMALRHRIYILDLNDIGQRRGTGTAVRMWGVTRPHVEEFLAFCFAYFKRVIVWSAGMKEYVDEVVRFLFRDLPMPDVVYARDKCTNIDGLLEKPLQKMIDSEPQLTITLTSTFALDDRKSTFERFNPFNGILIPRYEPGIDAKSMLEDETALVNLQEWLEKPEVIEASDVRSLNKSRIF